MRFSSKKYPYIRRIFLCLLQNSINITNTKNYIIASDKVDVVDIPQVGLDLYFSSQLMLHACFQQLLLLQDLDGNDELGFALSGQVNVAELSVAEGTPDNEVSFQRPVSMRWNWFATTEIVVHMSRNNDFILLWLDFTYFGDRNVALGTDGIARGCTFYQSNI